jgi:hypothetical protein
MSAKLNIVNTFENSTKKPIVFLVLIGLAGLLLRLVYFPYDVPLFNDSQGYFWYAIDMSILNQLPPDHSIVNNGWPSFLSVIFQLMDSNNFLDYHNMQRFVGVVFSVATVFPVYFLCSRYFKKSYSLLGATLFIFEPKIIQNSFLGIPESMYVFLMALLLFLFLSNSFKKIYFAFGIVALLAITKYEGLLMIIPLSVVFFIRFRRQKKDLIKYIICMSIFILVLIPMAYLRNDTMGQDGFVSHIAAGPIYYQTSIQENISTSADFLYLGSINLIKYLGWAQIPSFIIFVPLGIIFIFKRLDYKKITIILSILIMLIPAFYGYSREFQELKYLYVLYPIFCILACFTFKIFLEKFHRKNLIFCMIIGGIILSSVIFVEWKSIDNEHFRETYQILIDVGQKEMKINKEFGKYGQEILFFHWVKVQDDEKFPILKKELPSSKITYIPLSDWCSLPDKTKIRCAFIAHFSDNLRDYLQISEEKEITHLVLDEYNNAPGKYRIKHELGLALLDIFNHENNYAFLTKEYDSKENGFNYHIKIFKIDYDLYNEWKNEN